MESISIDLFLEQSNRINIGILNEGNIEAVIASCKSHNIECFIIDGHKIQSKGALLDYLYSSLQFPEYFGFNWDALVDVLRDILFGYGVIKNNLCLIYTYPTEFIRLNVVDFLTFVEIINELAEEQKDNFIKLIIEIAPQEFEKDLISQQVQSQRQKISYLHLKI